jgi:FkbM family methyltransferase
VISLDGARTFLQIGANDGYLSDPLNLAIFSYTLKGTFVEPQPVYFRELKRTYANFANMRFIRSAVTAQPGTMTMYTLDCTTGWLPSWARGVGTLSRDQIQKFGDQIDNIDDYIRTTEVNCITVAELLNQADDPNPDIIVVDAEGFDFVILSQFNFANLSVKLVIYETESMERQDSANIERILTSAGFAILEAGQDTIALRRDTNTFRKTIGRYDITGHDTN